MRKKASAGFLLGAEVVSCPFHSQLNIMRKKFILPSWATEQNNWFAELQSFFQHIGCDNFTNAQRKFDAMVNEIEQKNATIQKFVALSETTHVGNAYQRFASLMKGATPDELSKLPEAFHRPPAIWLSGKKKTLVKEGFAPMGVRDAERKHRVILPLLIEAWELAEGDENERLEIEKAYRNWSADEFEKELYLTINKLEEPTLEELLEERIAKETAEFEDWQIKNANERAKERKKRNTSRAN